MRVLLTGVIVAALLTAQPKANLTARELFYLPVSNSAPKSKAPAAPARPLGLKYTVYQYDGSRFVAQPSTRTYKSGDRVRVQIEANEAGNLYVVQKGTSGKWSPLRLGPNAENRIEAKKPLLIPRDPGVWTLEGAPGVEHIYVFIARKPQPDVQKALIAQSQSAMVTMIATRQKLQSRDLKYEEIPEEGVYVVDKTSKPDSNFLVEIQLRHQ